MLKCLQVGMVEHEGCGFTDPAKRIALLVLKERDYFLRTVSAAPHKWKKILFACNAYYGKCRSTRTF